MATYLELDLPEVFALHVDGSELEWGVLRAEWFVRLEDGTYVCTEHGGSPVYLRAVERDGLRFTHEDGGGRRFQYELRPQFPGDGPSPGLPW